MKIHFPRQRVVQDMFGNLLGREVTLQKVDPDLGSAVVVAAYADDRNALVAVVAWDLPLACGAGASLCLLPAGAAMDAVEAGTLDEELKEPVYEVLNILAQVLNSATTAHVRLVKVFHRSDGRPPPAVVRLLRDAPRTLSVQVDIKGYPGGRLLMRAAG